MQWLNFVINLFHLHPFLGFFLYYYYYYSWIHLSVGSFMEGLRCDKVLMKCFVDLEVITLGFLVQYQKKGIFFWVCTRKLSEKNRKYILELRKHWKHHFKNLFWKYIIFLEEFWGVLKWCLENILRNNWKFREYLNIFCIIYKHTML